jgi:hypothetical protein
VGMVNVGSHAPDVLLLYALREKGPTATNIVGAPNQCA